MIKLFKIWNHKLNVLLGCDTYNVNESIKEAGSYGEVVEFDTAEDFFKWALNK